MPELAGIGVGGRRRLPTGTRCGAIRPREVSATGKRTEPEDLVVVTSVQPFRAGIVSNRARP